MRALDRIREIIIMLLILQLTYQARKQQFATSAGERDTCNIHALPRETAIETSEIRDFDFDHKC